MNELNRVHPNNTSEKEMGNNEQDNHITPTTNKKESIIEPKNDIVQNAHIINFQKTDNELDEKEKAANYFSKDQEKCLESISKGPLPIFHIEKDMNRVVKIVNFSELFQKEEIMKDRLFEEHLRKLENQSQEEDKDRNQNCAKNDEKMNNKIISFGNIGNGSCTQKWEYFSNIPEPPSLGVSIADNLDDFQVQEFNDIEDIKLKDQRLSEDNICCFNVSTNFNNNINPTLTFPENTQNFEHYSDAPSA